MTVVVWVCLATCLYSIAADNNAQWDFHVYYAAARALAAGGNPYEPIYPHPWDKNDALFYVYPPLTLYLFRWSTLLSPASAQLVWLLTKFVVLALLVRRWHRDFESLDATWPTVLFLALGFNATLLRDVTAGNISCFEQLAIWFAFSMLLGGRLYATALTLACIAQFKFIPAAFLILIPLARPPRESWKPFVVGCAAFVTLLSANLWVSPELSHDYRAVFTDPRMHVDDRGIINPSSLALFRDVLDATAYAPRLPANVAAGTTVYFLYIVLLTLILIRVGWSLRQRLHRVDPKLLIYFVCALLVVVAPRFKDYSYMLMLIPCLFVVRDIGTRGIVPSYLLLGVFLMALGQPEQSSVPGLRVLIYMLHAYLPLVSSAAVMAYLLRMMLRTVDEIAPLATQERSQRGYLEGSVEAHRPPKLTTA